MHCVLYVRFSSEWYLRDLSRKQRTAIRVKGESGKPTTTQAIYGYKKDPDQKGHLIIDEEAAAVVREVFTLFSQGYGKTAIARMLNDRGIPNPTEYKRLHGLRYQQPKRKKQHSLEVFCYLRYAHQRDLYWQHGARQICESYIQIQA